MPFMVGLLATFVFFLGFGGESLARFAQETGWSFYAVVLSAWFGALVLTVALILAARGTRIPTGLSLFFAGLPWMVGVAGVRVSTQHILDALTNVDPAMRATLLAAGISEASGARLVGAWCTSALAGSLALGLAIAALGQRATNRKVVFGAVGFMLGLPLLALAVYAFTSRVFDTYALYLIVAACGTVLALALGAAGAGNSPHGRAAGLSAAVAPVSAIAFLGAIASMETGGFRGVLVGVAAVDPASRVAMLARGTEVFALGGRLAEFGVAALGFASLVLAGWAISRARPSIGALVSGAAVVVIAVLIVGVDYAAELATRHDVAAQTVTPWANLPDFAPIAAGRSGDERPGVPIAVVTVEQISPLGGTPIRNDALTTFAARTQLVEALRSAQTRARAQPDGIEDTRLTDLLRAPTDVGDAGPTDGDLPSPNGEPQMTLLVDARVPAPVLRTLFDAARAAGARSVVLVGAAERVDAAALARLREEAPLIALLAEPIGSVTVLFENALPPGYADRDPELWHGTVSRSGAGELTTRVGSGETARAIPTDVWHHDDESRVNGPQIVYLVLADDATAESLAVFALGARQHRLLPLVVAGAMIGAPDQPLVRGHGALGSDGSAGYAIPSNIGAASVRTATPDVRGALSHEVIRRVVHAHLDEVRACYARALAAQPTLSGRVEVRFIIAQTGAVQTAPIASSDLGAPEVDRCIAAAVQHWYFPAPDGGGIVAVTYPFVLRSD